MAAVAHKLRAQLAALLTTMWQKFLVWLDEMLEQIVHGDMHQVVLDHTEQPLPVTPTPMPTQTKAELLYTLSKGLLDTHLSLNDAVPWMVGCMEAVSKVLVEFDITGIPAKGIEGTFAGLDFLKQSLQFNEIYTYTPGAVVIAATGTGNGKIRGHVGICGNNSIMSNNSETGKWDTQWDIDRFTAYYNGYGAIPIRYFLPI